MTISGYHKHFSTKKAYNQADYYHTLPPKRSHTPEKGNFPYKFQFVFCCAYLKNNN